MKQALTLTLLAFLALCPGKSALAQQFGYGITSTFMLPTGDWADPFPQRQTVVEKTAVSPLDNILLYPNPVNDVLNICFDHQLTGVVDAKIYDMMGNVIDYVSSRREPIVISFPVGYLPAGLYFYEVKNEGYIARGKFQKQ